MDSQEAPIWFAKHFPPLATYCPILPQISGPQTAFLLSDRQEALYGGAVGGGKTAALLMAALMYVDVPGYAALILRRTFPELEQPDGPIWQSMHWFAQAPAAVQPKYTQGDHIWRFPSGAVIRFGHLDSADAVMRYQGGAYHYVGFDELTHFEQEQYEFIGLSRQRKPPHGPLSHVPMRIRASANPGGPGHEWVKRRFLTQPNDRVDFIPARLRDNPGIDEADYLSRLVGLSPVLRQQLIDGDWDAFQGAAYGMFRDDVHLVDPFDIPREWERFEGMDYGAANPTSWAPVAVDYDGNLIFYDLYYSPGLATDHALEILARRESSWGQPTGVWADPSIRNKTGVSDRMGRALSVEQEFSDHGISIVPANNDRAAGYMRVAQLLRPDPERLYPFWHPRYGEKGSPRLFFFRGVCDELVSQIRSAPIEQFGRLMGKAVDGRWETTQGHAHAMARYACLSRPLPNAPPVTGAQTEQELREEAARHALDKHSHQKLTYI